MDTPNYKLGNCQIFLATVTCPPDSDLGFWRNVSFEVAKAAGLTPLEWNSAGYPGGGLTVTWFLSESHIAVDTYPEHGLVDITLVSCKAFKVDEIEKTLNHEGLVITQKTLLQKRWDHKWRAFSV